MSDGTISSRTCMALQAPFRGISKSGPAIVFLRYVLPIDPQNPEDLQVTVESELPVVDALCRGRRPSRLYNSPFPAQWRSINSIYVAQILSQPAFGACFHRPPELCNLGRNSKLAKRSN
ncbi:hypothetical protein J6590_032805 [Homalodisca vitripennis]|nr:hypothetical protein J6590_032805 [Homalodisca vitripennis]